MAEESKKKTCVKFNRPEGCKYGDKCKYNHVALEECWHFFNNPKGCVYGDKCHKGHVRVAKEASVSMQSPEMQTPEIEHEKTFMSVWNHLYAMLKECPSEDRTALLDLMNYSCSLFSKQSRGLLETKRLL